MSKKLTVIVSLFTAIFFIATAFRPDTKPPGNWKNLKVLPQDISKDSLDAIMDHFKASLGVKCNFCHAAGSNGRLDFASDEKPEKDIARYMMKMTSDINKNYFNFNKSPMPDTIRVVSCYTCHNGNPHPEGVPPADTTHHGFPPPGGMPPGGMPPGGDHPPGSMQHNMTDSAKHN